MKATKLVNRSAMDKVIMHSEDVTICEWILLRDDIKFNGENDRVLNVQHNITYPERRSQYRPT